jgi:hypothetical protein
VDSQLLKILEVETAYQCEIGLAGGQLLDRGYGEAMQPGPGGYQDNIWFALQGILSIAANVAKLLWGSQGPEVETEREPLRIVAGVDDKSPLKPRKVRNAFEHFDERIICWWERGDTTVYASRKIGIDPDWTPAGSRFGYYEPKARTITFLNHVVSITDLLAEFERVHSNLST